MNEKMTTAIDRDLAVAPGPVREMTEAEKPKLEIVKEQKDENRPKKERKPRAPKARPIEELVEAPTKSLTEKEAVALIEYLKEQVILADNKIDALKQNIEAAYSRVRKTEDEFKSMETYYKERLAYVLNNTKSFYQSVCLATKGDVK